MSQPQSISELIDEALVLRAKLDEASRDLTDITSQLHDLKLRLDQILLDGAGALTRSWGSGASPVAERRLEADKTAAPASE